MQEKGDWSLSSNLADVALDLNSDETTYTDQAPNRLETVDKSNDDFNDHGDQSC